jgi:hypothetical protein
MRAFVMACVAAIVVAGAGAYVLNLYQQPADVAFSTTGVRL